MSLIRVTIAVLMAAGLASAGPAAASGKSYKNPPKKRVIIIDPSRYYGPPPPHQRTYVGPAPALAAPMAPVPRVAPLAQPPIR